MSFPVRYYVSEEVLQCCVFFIITNNGFFSLNPQNARRRLAAKSGPVSFQPRWAIFSHSPLHRLPCGSAPLTTSFLFVVFLVLYFLLLHLCILDVVSVCVCSLLCVLCVCAHLYAACKSACWVTLVHWDHFWKGSIFIFILVSKLLSPVLILGRSREASFFSQFLEPLVTRPRDSSSPGEAFPLHSLDLY